MAQYPPNVPPPYGAPVPPPARYSPVPPPPKPLSRGRIALIVGVLVGGLLLSGAVTLLNVVRTNADVHVPLVVGSSGTLAPGGQGLQKMQVTLATIGGNTSSPNSAAPIKQITVGVTLENTGRVPATPGTWQMRGSDGKEYRALTGSPLPLVLAAGAKSSGQLVFIVPRDVTIQNLSYGPHAPLNANLVFDAP